jgi:hypothetical protein
VGSFEDKHTPPEISRLTHHINRNAAEIEYYSRQRRGNSFGDANGFSEHEKSEISSLVLPTSMSSSWKAKTYLSGGAFVRGIESMDFKSITPDIDHQQRTHSPVKDHATKVQRDDVSVKTGKLLSINSTGSIASASGTASVSSTVPSVVTAPASASAVDSACRPAGPDARDTTSSGNTNSKRMEPKKRTSEGFL